MLVLVSWLKNQLHDIANKEQFTINIRWVGEDLQDHEDFIGLYQVESIDANCLVFTIIDALLWM